MAKYHSPTGFSGRSYAPEAFADLAEVIRALDAGEGKFDRFYTELPHGIQAFFSRDSMEKSWHEMARNTSTALAFRKRFFRWFDAFQVMKYLNYTREKLYGDYPAVDCANTLLAWRNEEGRQCSKATELLRHFRSWEKSPEYQIKQ